MSDLPARIGNDEPSEAAATPSTSRHPPPAQLAASTRTPYDEGIYQRALDARRAQQSPSQTVEPQWINVAGFSKLGIANA